jgi:branched-chain amino acid transport system substrate-binding protein
MQTRHFATVGVPVAGFVLATGAVLAAGQYGPPGASDTEIKIGSTMPYSGPASAYDIIGKTEAAYFSRYPSFRSLSGRNGHEAAGQDRLHRSRTTHRGIRPGA